MKCMCPKCGSTQAILGQDGVVCHDCNEESRTSEAVAPKSAYRSDDYDDDFDDDDGFDDDDDDDDDDDGDWGGNDGYEESYGYSDQRDGRDLSHIKTRIKMLPKKNTVELNFCLGGAPGDADKRVEFLFFDKNNPSYKRTATLSNKRATYVDYVDADCATIYKTHWKCKEDGLAPFQAVNVEITARVY